MRCANAFCCDMVDFVFSAEKVLAFKKRSATIQENKRMFGFRNKHISAGGRKKARKSRRNTVFICAGCGCQAYRS